MMKIRAMILLVLVCMVFGCSNLTADNYAKITTGMAYGEVIKILGKPDNSSEALFVKNCVWGNEQKNITVNFVADKVMFSTSRNIR